MSDNIQYINTKSILSKLRQPDNFFGIGYNINLYRGCQHACIYCDTRSDCYGIGDISKISVKQNALELLKIELKSKRKNKATIGTGSMNDPYMPIENEIKLTQNALKIISEEKFPVHIITKSDLVMRDYEILQEISKTYAAVSFTITTYKDEISRKIEPYAASSSNRFKAIEFLAKKGIYTGITLMPLLPYINDDVENIENIMKLAKDAGASYVIPMFGLTLRKGSRDYLYKIFDKEFPGLKEKYDFNFKENYICNSPNYKELSSNFSIFLDKYKLKEKMDFHSPSKDIQLSLF